MWKHPDVTPEEARQMLFECDSMCNTFSCNVGFAMKEAVRNVIPFVIKKMVNRRFHPMAVH